MSSFNESTTTASQSELVAPQGGTLVDFLLSEAVVEALRERSVGPLSLIIGDLSLSNLELVGVGTASPVCGVLCETDASVLEHVLPANAAVLALPLTLLVPVHNIRELRGGDEVALRTCAGRPWGRLAVRNRLDLDLHHPEALAVYRTSDAAGTSRAPTRKLRDECLNENSFPSLDDARRKNRSYLVDYSVYCDFDARLGRPPE